MSKSKSDIAEQVSIALDITKADANKAVNAVIDAIGDALKDGDDVRLSGLGNFSVKTLPARAGRNPATGEQINIAASKKVSFKVAADLKRSL